MSSPALRKVILPELGLGEVPLQVSRWLYQQGSTVIIEDPLVEILSDGVSITLPAPATGILRAQLIPAGESIQPGDQLGLIECEEEE